MPPSSSSSPPLPISSRRTTRRTTRQTSTSTASPSISTQHQEQQQRRPKRSKPSNTDFQQQSQDHARSPSPDSSATAAITAAETSTHPHKRALMKRQPLKTCPSPPYAGIIVAANTSANTRINTGTDIRTSYSYTVPRHVEGNLPVSESNTAHQSGDVGGASAGSRKKGRPVKVRKFDAGRTVMPFLDERARSALIELANEAG